VARTDNKILALLGFSCTGDLGPWTLYTSARHQIVFYPRVPALNPASPLQTVMRDRWRQAAATWRMLTDTDRTNWEEASKRASLKITGYNLWVYYSTSNDRAAVDTIARQSGLPLLP
jgi:hypothetical protein